MCLIPQRRPGKICGSGYDTGNEKHISTLGIFFEVSHVGYQIKGKYLKEKIM